jgi:hypothetical protein
MERSTASIAASGCPPKARAAAILPCARALTYSFARISAALKMKVEDLRPRGAGWTIRLHEKGGKQHAMPAITPSPRRAACLY